MTCPVTQAAQAHRCERNMFHVSLRKEENTVSAWKSHMKNKELWGSELLWNLSSKWKHTHKQGK